ncbi:MAG: hypothetical protein ABIZ80_06520 [Bryobacteraceae bacterium]
MQKKVSGKWKHIIICPNRALFQSLTALLGELTPGSPFIDLKTYPTRRALTDAVTNQGPNICFLDVGSSWDSATPLIAELSSMTPPIPVVAVHTGNDPDLILRSLRQGANEFLYQPFTGEQVGSALDRLARLRHTSNVHSRELGKVYAVIPGKGASGASTVASNLAFQLLRQNPKHKVLLADLDATTGTLSFGLKLRSNYSFVDALVHSSQLDSDLWRALVTSQQGVDVLLSPETPINGSPSHHDAAAMIEYSRENYGTIVADLSSPFGEWNLTLARLCDELLLVTSNELPALHSTQKAVVHLERNGIERSKIKLVVNRFNPDAGLGREAIEMALHLDVFHQLPSDHESVQRSLLEGKPVPATSALGRSIAAMTDRLTGRQTQAKRQSLLSGLFSLFDSTLHKA